MPAQGSKAYRFSMCVSSLSKRKLGKDEDHEVVQETWHHHEGNSVRSYPMSTVATKKRRTEDQCSKKEEENVES